MPSSLLFLITFFRTGFDDEQAIRLKGFMQVTKREGTESFPESSVYQSVVFRLQYEYTEFNSSS